MSGAASRRPGLVALGTIGVALCCALPALAGLGALAGVGVLWGPAAATVVIGALGVVVALRRSHRDPDGTAHEQSEK